MDYKTLENKLISKIEKNKSCSKTIKENKNLINENFDNIVVVKNFINNLNNAILKAKKYDETEKLLKDPSMRKVLEVFRESDILIRACEERNKKAAKWLLSMNINRNVHDKKGMTALMYASTYYDMESIVEALIKMDENQLNTVDEDGNTALFHAVKIKAIFDKLIVYKIDTNYRNKQGDTIFTHICRCYKPKLIKSLLDHHKDVDFSVVNNDGKTGAMYLAESDNFTELRNLFASGANLNLTYKNEKNETIVSQTINRFYDRFKDSSFKEGATINFFDDDEIVKRDKTQAIKLARTFNALIDLGCDFNCVVDGDGNTPLMFFLMIKDYVSALNLLQYCKTMDLTITNKFGISALDIASQLTEKDFSSLKNIKQYLFIEIDYDIFRKELTNYPTYNSKTVKEIKGDVITYYLKPEKLLTLESAISEGYFYRAGEDNRKDIMDKLLYPLMMFETGTPFA